jgi:hypothetical protein
MKDLMIEVQRFDSCKFQIKMKMDNFKSSTFTMPRQTLDSKAIDTLRNLPDLIPVYREYYDDWTIRVFDRKGNDCKNYLSPNRRDFYKSAHQYRRYRSVYDGLEYVLHR